MKSKLQCNDTEYPGRCKLKIGEVHYFGGELQKKTGWFKANNFQSSFFLAISLSSLTYHSSPYFRVSGFFRN